jgi:hypothetical protein
VVPGAGHNRHPEGFFDPVENGGEGLCMHKRHGLSIGCSVPDMIQLGSKVLNKSAVKDSVRAAHSTKSPARGKGAFSIFAANADATGGSGRGNIALSLSNIYSCLSVESDVNITYEFSEGDKIILEKGAEKGSPRVHVPTFPGRERGKRRPGGKIGTARRAGSPRPCPERVWKAAMTLGGIKRCATLVAWGMLFFLACLQMAPLEFFGKSASPFSEDSLPAVMSEYKILERDETILSAEWMDEMMGRRAVLKGATRLNKGKIFLASRRGVSMGTNWSTCVKSRVTLAECCARGMKNPGKNISVLNMEIRVNNFISRAQRAAGKARTSEENSSVLDPGEKHFGETNPALYMQENFSDDSGRLPETVVSQLDSKNGVNIFPGDQS